MSRVVIGVDPHKASNTLVVIDAQERLLAQQRFANDRAGYRSMKTFARAHRDRVWAVEGARGVGAGLAQRLVAEGEPVPLSVAKTLPTRKEAIGELLAAILGPGAALAGCLAGPASQLAGILSAIEEKAKAAGDGAPAPASG